ncbi:phosphoribosylglycinamide formyltransferase-1 [Labrenzia sp. EL_208]|uniref:Phosphoribosylglycinamide formyltransferase n=1 Tax=Roseibium album TaxID=311410 RepID=A0A0M7AV71_9HYPH|nr:phosphoribosylglycinamide formyltransferase [Roseibium album]MBG6161115.1 phosphoribosylglycinamide formyltransferase-1 [Labrenzia sp. EL_195]MBG6177314.1 phosphoribosylglycinamide formyltransferase-1 [Labrenzia sp. EL_132]MBG6231935.1 phosphoribosylglycinamide formyltransferase-1 [Labrenzia sp. EL_208]CTQ61680.1 Phosphoribosylglycinamide formyltransferase [Roseibium album]CTQ75531.1 Phosphoribosylglycinamide formyltransferase [Roseibium album]
MNRKRTAVLISGRGSNMGALISAAMAPSYPAEITLVISNRPDAKGLERAAEFGIATAVVDHKDFAGDRQAFEKAIDDVLKEHRIDLVALAGFMRILTPYLVNAWSGRMINIHPALLPSFKGLATHERALEEGVKLHGATVHFVSAEMDDGPIIVQGAVPVLDHDTPDTLAARVLDVEHKIYPKALELVATGKTKVTGARVVTGAENNNSAELIWP